jgi:CRISPR/Cas system CMR subunit Cmr6 (Cas7 group RAMP superfamily)
MPVEVYLISSNLEGAVKENIERKEEQARVMSDAMIEKMREWNKKNVSSLKTEKTEYNPTVSFLKPAFLEV